MKYIKNYRIGILFFLCGWFLFFISGPVYDDWIWNTGNVIGMTMVLIGVILFPVYLITRKWK
jgi:hypothetical protein